MISRSFRANRSGAIRENRKPRSGIKHDKTTGKFEVVAGARRLADLQKLAKENNIPKTFAVSCLLVAAATAPELTLAEIPSLKLCIPQTSLPRFAVCSIRG
jgi:hypothetical protein